ncbi:MAG: gluconate 2-dehydrogenase subunit 3 family protein [Pedosphaera sp.]|nr:gluconate 2-dehydrogenase subunit 3 family protein [Pedosphaera sp.]
MNLESGKLDRREAIRMVFAAAATISVLNQQSFGATPLPAQPYGTDALLRKDYKPGDFWPLTLSDEQKVTTRALADLILPEDDTSVAASKVGVVDFIDEWISAPYELQQTDRKRVLDGLRWLEAESRKRFLKTFADLNRTDQSSIADDICNLGSARSEFKIPAEFFAAFRNLTAGGYYATQKGWKDIGYVGNVVLFQFPGPPRTVLEKLGLEKN